MCPDFEIVLYEEKDGIAVITLNRPEVLNALITQMNMGLRKAFKAAKEDGEVRNRQGFHFRSSNIHLQNRNLYGASSRRILIVKGGVNHFCA